MEPGIKTDGLRPCSGLHKKLTCKDVFSKGVHLVTEGPAIRLTASLGQVFTFLVLFPYDLEDFTLISVGESKHNDSSVFCPCFSKSDAPCPYNICSFQAQ